MWGASKNDWDWFASLDAAKEDLLPVVSNLKACVSPLSNLTQLGKTPSIYNAQRQVVGFSKWSQNFASTAQILSWSQEPDYGICIQTRKIRALDFDIEDRAIADEISKVISKYGLPRRSRSNSSKFLVIFEFEGHLSKRKFKAQSGIVELLATGQQFIAMGTHPSGIRYEWTDGLPKNIPKFTASQIEEIWSALADEFAIEAPTTQAYSVKSQKLSSAVQSDPIAQHLVNTNRVKRIEGDGRLHIFCPWESEHSKETSDSSTTYFPAHTGGYSMGHFCCKHAHCEDRKDQDFLDAIEFNCIDEFEAIQNSSPSQTSSVSEEKTCRFNVQPAHLFAHGQPPKWLIKRVLPKANLAVLFGESGSGKTFAALDMAVDIAMGTSWRGINTKQGKVVYIAAEGADGFRKRLQAAAAHRSIELKDLPIGVIADTPNLMDKNDATDIAKSIKAAQGADLVIVDTFAQVMPGANENAGEDVGRALGHCKGINKATGALVMLIHHSGKDRAKGARGWSGLRAAADVELEVIRVGDERSITITKQKDGEDGSEFCFKLQNIVLGMDEDGEEITSCYIEHSGGNAIRRRDKGPRGKVQKVVLSIIRELTKNGTQSTDLETLSRVYLSKTPKEIDIKGRDRRIERVKRVCNDLLVSQRISMTNNLIEII